MKLDYVNICLSSLFFGFSLESNCLSTVWLHGYSHSMPVCPVFCALQCHQSPDCDIRTLLCSLCLPPVNKMSMCARRLLTMFKEIRKLRISHTTDRIFIGLFYTLNC